MNRLLLLLGIVLLQISPELTGEPRRPVERPHTMDEAEVDSLAPTTGARVPVWVEALEGLPAVAEARAAFLKGFRSRFLERELATERFARRAGIWKADAPVVGLLRLADAMDEKGAWSVRVQLDWYVPRDSLADSLARTWPGRAARVTVTTVAPETPSRAGTAPARAAAPLAPRAEWLRFPPGHPVDAAYYQLAGRQVACLVIEAVQRARGELSDDRRLRLEQTERTVPTVGR